MAFDSLSPMEEPIASKKAVEDLASMEQPIKIQVHESSDDDIPVISQRSLRPNRQIAKPTMPKKAIQSKRPGPSPHSAKPIMKNDMKAKMAVVRDIEGHWGKNFIRAYIPKCHRPLVKRSKHGKRSIYREHETDPKKWLPSVLKAILMIAQLTKDKNWLAKAMNDVVRYRIKNTGNRKPQLVTTDFDVIEDMLVKDWTVPYAFEIRYKHLLVHRKDMQETDEDIDHILQAGEEQEEDSDGGNTNDEEDVADQELSDVSDGLQDDDAQYLPDSEYMGNPEYRPSPAVSRQSQPPKLRGIKKETAPPRPILPPHYPYHQQGMYGYGTPIDTYGRPLHGYGGYNGHGGYGGGYGGYGPPPFLQGSREVSQPASLHPRHRSSSYNFHPHASIAPYTAHPRIKRESLSPSERMAAMDPLPSCEDQIIDDNDQENSDDIELKALELELKVARLKAKKARKAAGK